MRRVLANRGALWRSSGLAPRPVGVRPLERGRARGWPVIGESDSDLVARVRSGDEGAFEAIYDRYHRGLLAFCRHMLGGRHDAEDALQLSLVSAYRALG